MKRVTLSVILSILVYGSASAQSDVKSWVDKLKQAVTTVQTASKKYEPTVEFIPPAVVKYSYNEIDSKGATTAYAIEFNLADIDVYTVRTQPQKDLMQVVLTVKRKQKLIKTYKNNHVQPYTEQIELFAKDVDNSRAISDIIKNAIPPAEKAMDGRLKLSDYQAMVNYIVANVKNVTLEDRSFNQVMAKGDKLGTLRFQQTESTGKAAVEEVFTFNLADINPNSVVFKISGDKMAVALEVLANAKYVGVSKNGEVKPYVNDVTIYTNGVDEARDLISVFTKAIALASESVKKEINTGVDTDKAALGRIASLTGTVGRGTKQITQTITPACICVLTQTIQDAKTTKAYEYKFNWIDINPNASNIDVTGDQMFVELQTNDNKKLLMEKVDQKFTGYESKSKIFFSNIEDARRAKVALEKAVTKCKAAYKDPFGSDLTSSLNWIKGNVKDVTIDEETLNQKLESIQGEKADKVKLTTRKLNAKGGGPEEVFEFSIADINPLSIEIAVKGKWMFVTMDTNYKGKIIKAYKDGKPMPYASSVEFALNDVELSRNMVTALKNAIKALKPN